MDLSIDQYIASLSNFIENRHFAGYDPYDALNSPLIRAFCFNKKYCRIAWIQLLRRLPVNLRPFLLMPAGHNPKALGLFLQGFVKLYEINPKTTYLENINVLFKLLNDTVSKGYSGNCWGYNFDWQNRAFWIPKHTPTIVNSSFIGHALLDGWASLGERRFLDMALSIKNFLLKDLHRTYENDTFCFSYTPLDYTAVHNANLLGASLLIRLYQVTKEAAIRECALKSLAYSMNHQHKDGSWFYGEADIQHWIDSFHTGFNLEAIRYFLRLGEAEEYRSAFEKGVSYYAENFFLEDGTPKYYHDRVYPIDIHAPAQAIAFFSGEGEKYRDLTERILSWMLKNMWDKRGFFYFRKGRFFTNKIPYMRWSQAWCFRALTSYLAVATREIVYHFDK